MLFKVYKNYFVTQIGRLRNQEWWNRLPSDVIQIQHYGFVMGGTEILRHGKYRRKAYIHTFIEYSSTDRSAG